MGVSYDYKGKNVVVTGGAQGIGLEIAGRFLRAGARVALWDWDEAALAAAVLLSRFVILFSHILRLLGRRN